jgi:hypothetical protein
VFEKFPSRSSQPEKKPLPARRDRGVDFGGVLETRIRHAPRIPSNARTSLRKSQMESPASAVNAIRRRSERMKPGTCRARWAVSVSHKIRALRESNLLRHERN